MVKKALIVSAFYNYDYPIRISFLESLLSNYGFGVTVLSSDFDHRNKKYYSPNMKNVEMLHVPCYSKNLSVKRIISHCVFSRKAQQFCLNYQPDLIYAITPPNTLFKCLSKVKSLKPSVKLIFEIEDLWPESLPVGNTVKRLTSPLFYLWRRVRDKHINTSDALVFECDLFKNYILQCFQQPMPSITLYLSKKDSFQRQSFFSPNHDYLRFLYLGSINNLIDVDLIMRFLSVISEKKPTEFHIIGGGEQLGNLLELCSLHSIPVINHGMIYDDLDKGDIINHCHFAFNIMKQTVFVGATMKSLEYFHYGIPLINNISGDTTEIVEKYKCGFNINSSNLESIADIIVSKLDNDSYDLLRRNARNVYEELFCPEVYMKKMSDFLLNNGLLDSQGRV